MKKYALILSAICACLIVSCNKEPQAPKDETINPAMQTVTISANICDNLTKTSYANGTTFSWTAGDQISVLCSDGNFYTFTADETAAESTFTGSIPAGESLGNYAFFPADEGHLYSGLKFCIPEYKDLTSHPSADMPMVGDKGEGDAYSFMHCSGASLFTLDNIPSKIKSVKVSFVSASLKLSGLFGMYKSSEQWRWNANPGINDSEKTFARKVSVVNGKAEVYLPYAWAANMWADNTVTVTGYDASNQEYALISGKTMKGKSDNFERAHVRPLTPLIMNNFSLIDWSTIDGSTSDGNYAAFKVTSDDYYVYFYSKVKKAAVKWGTTAGTGENGSYVYFGVDTDLDSTTGTDFWGNAGKFDSIVLVYPFDLGESIRTAPYVKVNGSKKGVDCTGTVGEGDDAMVEFAIAVLRTDLNVSKGTTVNVYSYASSNISQYSSEFAVTL